MGRWEVRHSLFLFRQSFPTDCEGDGTAGWTDCAAFWCFVAQCGVVWCIVEVVELCRVL